MSKRSPVLGYNHNFKHRGLIFHVQTEDSGVDNPHLFTHLFHGGVIISSRKVDYDAASAEDIVKSLMQSQHKAVLKDLKIGTFDDKIDAYLGDKEDLLPRKADSVSGTQAAVTPEPDRAATEPSVETPIPDTEPLTPAPVPDEPRATVSYGAPPIAEAPVAAASPETSIPETPIPATPPATPPPATPELAHSGAISLDTPGSAIPQMVADSSATIPVHVPPDAVIELDMPLPRSTKHRHERDPIPTPIAIPVVTGEELGDPVVTFTTASAAPTAEIPPEALSERSATYSIQRPHKRRRATTQTRSALGQPRSPQTPERQSTERPSGKAANPQPGTRRSSVVVSRPAVIIGAPARSVGRDTGRRSNRRTPPTRRKSNKDLFGNDTISEKSLDEVIMAYLSEDNSDD